MRDYLERIAAHPAASGLAPRSVLAMICIEHRTLDHLSADALDMEIVAGAYCTQQSPALAKRVADSMGIPA